jgi:hypothetical protein
MSKVVPLDLIYEFRIFHNLWRQGRYRFLFFKSGVGIGFRKSLKNQKTVGPARQRLCPTHLRVFNALPAGRWAHVPSAVPTPPCRTPS